MCVVVTNIGLIKENYIHNSINVEIDPNLDFTSEQFTIYSRINSPQHLSGLNVDRIEMVTLASHMYVD